MVEVGLPEKKASEDAPGQLSIAVVGDEEETKPRGEDGAMKDDEGNTNTTSTSKLKHDLKMAFALITMAILLLIQTFFLHRSTGRFSKNPTLILAAFSAFTAFVLAVGLMFQSMKLLSLESQPIGKTDHAASKVLYCSSLTSLLLAWLATTFSLLRRVYYFLPLVFVLALLVAGSHFLLSTETDAEESRKLKKDLKRARQLTLSLVSMAFPGFLGALLVIYHNPSSLGGHHYSYVKFAVFLMLGAALAGILAMLLCRVLSKDHQRSGRHRKIAILTITNSVMLGMLVPSALMIAATVLEWLTVATLFPMCPAAAAELFVVFSGVAAINDGCLGSAEGGKAEHGNMYAMSVAVISVSFGGIVALFAGLLGGVADKEQLRVCMFFLASAFVSAVSLVVVTFRAPKKTTLALSSMVLACSALGLLVQSGPRFE